jgi:hypothetical protein
MNLTIEKWIINEFGKKNKKNRVPVGSAYQANIPDLEEKKYDTAASINCISFNKISINLRKLTNTDIQSIKKNL